MAKLRLPAGIGGNRDPARGPGYRISMWRGLPRVYSKQVGKKKKLSLRQREAMFQFGALAEVAKAVSGTDIANALYYSKGSQYLWRDLIYMVTAGRAFHYSLPNGEKAFSVAARTTVSDMIEAISQTPGSMLYRDQSWWNVVPPGLNGQVLQYNTAERKPEWVDAPSGGGGAGIASFKASTISSSTFATKGTDITSQQAYTYVGCQVFLNPATSTSYKVMLIEHDGSEVTAILAQSDPHTFSATGDQRFQFEFQTPAAVPAETRAAMLLVRAGPGSNPALGMGTAQFGLQGIPLVHDNTYVRASTNSISVGTALEVTAAGQFEIMPWWQ